MKNFKEYILEYEIDHDGHGNYRDDEGNTWTSKSGGAHRSSFGRRHTITSHQPDHPHSVHINGKKWKTFGSHSHATNVAKKIKGATVHKEVELEEAFDPSEVAGNPKVYSSEIVKKAYYHKNATAEDKKSLERHLDRHHGNKEWRKSVKESEESDKHYKEAEDHLSKANDADAKGDKKSFHAHMANHHDAMSEWHESKGRSASADKHAEKADYHHEKSLKEQTITELSSNLLQRYKDKAMKSVDALNSKGKHKKANDRLLAHMKATGKQIEKTTANIRKAIGK